jgi:pyruvate, orthophosphate dikinase
MRWVQRFEEGDASQRDLLGGKGANLAEMTRMGLPVPPGFTITTAACRAYREHGYLPAGVEREVTEAIAALEEATGTGFGDPSAPLLVSVRSGAASSMPGMMDTVLDLGMTPETVKGLAASTGDERLARDAERRFVEVFSTTVLGVGEDTLAHWRQGVLGAHGTPSVEDLDATGLADLSAAYRTATRHATGHEVPEDVHRQLLMAIEAVFRSWDGARAREYRRIERIADGLGTAVNVQVMVLGNAGPDSGTGVAFTRDPVTGERAHYGDFLVHAQGEDVVAGTHPTLPLARMQEVFPEAAAELAGILDRLETHFGDMCDVEFTVEHGRLWILQTRAGKRTAAAAVRIAVDLVDEGRITPADALQRVTPSAVESLLHPRFASTDTPAVATGLAASPGAAVGACAFTADDARDRAAAGEDVVLLRPETSPDDLHGIVAAQGVLTARGGLVSHAAVVARGFGIPAVCSCLDLVVDHGGTSATLAGLPIDTTTVLSIDGTTGAVHLGPRPVEASPPPAELHRLLAWADELAAVRVHANADTAEDLERALLLGARGVGLARTEHQFLGDRVELLRDALLEDGPDARTEALARLHRAQVEELTGLLRAAAGRPVDMRLLDPPLHEFLPDRDHLRDLAATGDLDEEGTRLLAAVERWREQNPMLGTRGVRLGLLLPELYAAQVRAVSAAVRTLVGEGQPVDAGIMLPLVSTPAELHAAVLAVRDVLAAELDVPTAAGVRVGSMVETPRAALLAGQLASDADFLSFGTNDLTQLTFGFSRDDVAGRVIAPYLQQGLLDDDPFASLDIAGVGSLVRTAVEGARATRPDIELGICGEQGADESTIAFAHALGLDHVSVSPFRVPSARLAAGRVAIAARETRGLAPVGVT